MRRLLDVLTLALIGGAIALQGAFLTAIGGTPGAPSAPTARRQVPDPAPLAARVCEPATGRKC